MKHLKLTLLSLLTLAFSGLQAQSLDEIVTKHIDAIGGIEAWRKITSIRQEGTLQAQGAEVTVVRTILNGKGTRQDITVAGMTGYNILTPVAGWNYMPFQGQKEAEPMTDEDVKEGQSDLDVQDELVEYKQKGTTVELVGKDDVEGTECFKLLVTFKSGKTESIFIDPKSYYIIRQISKQKANGQEMDITYNFSNYQKLPEGIVVALSISLPFGELKITKTEVNKPVDETIFKPAN